MLYEGKGRIWIAGLGELIDPSEHEVANDSDWTAGFVNDNPANSYVVGRFVEADRPNENKQTFSLADLIAAKPTISYAPLNINHDQRSIIGAFIATEMVAASESMNSHIEALSAFWRYYFPDSYGMVKKAHNEGSLSYSMEALPRALSSIGGADDSKLYPYEGRTSSNYPDEINDRSCTGVLMHQPHFVGGALVIPPARPGWKKAEIKQISKFLTEQFDTAEDIYEGVKKESPHLTSEQWEGIMGELILLEQKREEQFDVADTATFSVESEQDLVHRALHVARGIKGISRNIR